MDINRSQYNVLLANAFTNNTFDLKETEHAIRRTMYNSFQYLLELQKSYIGVSRFINTEEDLYMDYDTGLYLSIPKDFIESIKRKDYRLANYFNTELSLSDITSHKDVFSYLPYVLLDGIPVFDYKVILTLDGKTVFKFTHINEPRKYVSESHTIETTFFKNADYHTFITNKYVIENMEYALDSSITNVTFDNTMLYFFCIKDTENTSYDSNLYPCTITENKLVLDKDNESLMDVINTAREVEFTILSISDMYEVSGTKEVKTRVDGKGDSALFIIDENQTYSMPIPTENLVVFKSYTESKRMEYVHHPEIILHYPNMYEIKSVERNPLYTYKVFYLYKTTNEVYQYKNSFHYIYSFFQKELNCNTVEEAINLLLYDTTANRSARNYFLQIFDHEEYTYIYDHKDFFSILRPYDFDYKVDKLTTFIEHNPDSLKEYAKIVSKPFETYYLETKNIDLPNRLRNDTTEELGDSDTSNMVFSEPHYVFMFFNEFDEPFDFRFFVDGLLCTSYHKIHHEETDYIYIPTRFITEDSYIEIEKFNQYTYRKTIHFDNLTTPITVEFDSNPDITPTLYDLFITDTSLNKIDRNLFKIYALVNNDAYDISDDLLRDDTNSEVIMLNNDYYYDEETGELYIDIDELLADGGTSVYLDDADTLGEEDPLTKRMQVHYMALTKLRLHPKDTSVIDRDLYLTINKMPYMNSMTVTRNGMVSMQLFNRIMAWRNASSYIRTFINGRFVPLDFTLTERTPGNTNLMLNASIQEGSLFTLDISPFSYELEYRLEEIPDSFLVDLNGRLSKPFSLDYYDVYLNGRKLTERNIQEVTPTKIKIFNVSSRLHLLIYRRDRDIEFYGFTTSAKIQLDDFLESNLFSDAQKESVISDMIANSHPGMTITPGTNTEEDVGDVTEEIPQDSLESYNFFFDIILPQRVVRPNSLFLDKEVISTTYQSVYTTYSNDVDRIVMKPNVNYNAKTVLKIGKAYEN